jgi:hypothetical protein
MPRKRKGRAPGLNNPDYGITRNKASTVLGWPKKRRRAFQVEGLVSESPPEVGQNRKGEENPSFKRLMSTSEITLEATELA